jgi:hypothetical protein
MTDDSPNFKNRPNRQTLSGREFENLVTAQRAMPQQGIREEVNAVCHPAAGNASDR